jgi:hypothetical protein
MLPLRSAIGSASSRSGRRTRSPSVGSPGCGATTARQGSPCDSGGNSSASGTPAEEGNRGDILRRLGQVALARPRYLRAAPCRIEHEADEAPAGPDAGETRTRSPRRSSRRRRGWPRTGPGSRFRWRWAGCRRRSRAAPIRGCRSLRKPAHSAGERPAGDPRRRHHSQGVASPWRWVSRSRSPSVQPPCARAVRPSGQRRLPAFRQIDYKSPVGGRMTGHPMPAPAPREQQVVVTREVDCRRDVVGCYAAGDKRRAPVDHAVPDLARRVVARVPGSDELTSQARGEVVDCRARKVGFRTLNRHSRDACRGPPPSARRVKRRTYPQPPPLSKDDPDARPSPPLRLVPRAGLSRESGRLVGSCFRGRAVARPRSGS